MAAKVIATATKRARARAARAMAMATKKAMVTVARLINSNEEGKGEGGKRFGNDD